MSEKLHGFVPGMPLALLLGLSVWPLAGFTRGLQEYTALLVVGGQGFFLCSVGSGPPCVLMDSRL